VRSSKNFDYSQYLPSSRQPKNQNALTPNKKDGTENRGQVLTYSSKKSKPVRPPLSSNYAQAPSLFFSNAPEPVILKTAVRLRTEK
jgi:hypothetical protein